MTVVAATSQKPTRQRVPAAESVGVSAWTGRAACAWAAVFALMSLYWAAGGLAGGETLGVEIEGFDAAVGRAEALEAEVVRPPHRNPPDGPGGPAHRELWLHDPDGYLVVLASPDGESPWPDPRVG